MRFMYIVTSTKAVPPTPALMEAMGKLRRRFRKVGEKSGELRACSGTIAANGGLRSDGVVPVAVELVAKDVDGVHLVICDFDACRIGVPINFGSHF